jgi:hypothetical protein
LVVSENSLAEGPLPEQQPLRGAYIRSNVN